MDDEFEQTDVPDADRTRAVLRHVAEYRDLCAKVRKSGTRSLLFGSVMLFIWYALFYNAKEQYSILSLIHLGLAVLEFGAGFVNRFLPSAEGVLFDALVLGAFGAATLLRQYLISQGLAPNPGGRNPDWVLIVFGAFWLWQGVRHARGYAALSRRFRERPSRGHVRWFEDLLAEVHSSDPESDPQALDLPTKPRLKAKLLGATALFVVPGSGEVIITARDDVSIEREPAADPDRLPAGYLVLDGLDLGRFRLHPENWRNYAAWKSEKR